MAVDWIKMRTDIYRDPKVSVIADALLDPKGDLARYVNQNCQSAMTVTRNVMRNVTVGALVAVWGVMRHRGKRVGDDLVCRGVSVSVLDDIAELPGFGAAMEESGWVVETDESIVFPCFFGEHNVDPEEKAKAQNSERQRRFRERRREDSPEKSNVTSNVTVTPREEKRREEKDQEQPLNPLSQGGTPADVEKPKRKRRGGEGQTMREYGEACAAADLPTIPNDSAVWAWAESVEVPTDFVWIAWLLFEDKYDANPKRYSSWPRAFLDHLKQGWIRAWRFTADGQCVLTDAGLQKQREWQRAAA